MSGSSSRRTPPVVRERGHGYVESLASPSGEGGGRARSGRQAVGIGARRAPIADHDSRARRCGQRGASGRRRPVHGLGARVGEGLPRDGDELPLVARGVQRQLQHAVGAGVAHLARGGGRGEAVVGRRRRCRRRTRACRRSRRRRRSRSSARSARSCASAPRASGRRRGRKRPSRAPACASCCRAPSTTSTEACAT